MPFTFSIQYINLTSSDTDPFHHLSAETVRVAACDPCLITSRQPTMFFVLVFSHEGFRFILPVIGYMFLRSSKQISGGFPNVEALPAYVVGNYVNCIEVEPD